MEILHHWKRTSNHQTSQTNREKKVAITALDLKYKTFVVHVAALSVNPGDEMHPLKRAQIVHLKADEVLTKVSSKYADFVDVISPKLATQLSEYMRINDYAIKLVDDWQLPYSLIYNLGPVKLKTLKTYIENNLVNSFIRPFKFFAEALILFDKKPDGSLRLYMDYRGLNNLTIKT